MKARAIVAALWLIAGCGSRTDVETTPHAPAIARVEVTVPTTTLSGVTIANVRGELDLPEAGAGAYWLSLRWDVESVRPVLGWIVTRAETPNHATRLQMITPAREGSVWRHGPLRIQLPAGIDHRLQLRALLPAASADPATRCPRRIDACPIVRSFRVDLSAFR